LRDLEYRRKSRRNLAWDVCSAMLFGDKVKNRWKSQEEEGCARKQKSDVAEKKRTHCIPKKKRGDDDGFKRRL